MKNNHSGFTLIEVLLALAVISIALTALIKATGNDVIYMQRIKDKSISHWVAMQGVAMVQLGLIEVKPQQEASQVTAMLGQRWYWRAKLNSTAIKSMQQITITVSKSQSGPFMDPLIAFKFIP
jgi:general secretion pathway protein I